MTKLKLLAALTGIATLAGVAISAKHKSATQKTNASAASKRDADQNLRKAKALATKQPLAFEENRGQADSRVKFLAHARGYTTLLTPAESVVQIGGENILSMRLRDGNQAPRLEGQELQTGKSNYLIGPDRSKWITGIAHFAKIRYRDAYPGIDAVYRGDEKQLEYDFVVRAGADPASIRMNFDGTSQIALNREGELELHTAKGVLVDRKPTVYQTINGQRKPVDGRFELLAKNEVGFQVGPYDRSKDLVIDPVLIVAGMLGGTSNDEGYGIAANASGILLTGRTQSSTVPTLPSPTLPALPTTSPAGAGTGFPIYLPLSGQSQHSGVPNVSWNVFISKFTIDPITTEPLLQYSTYLAAPGSGAQDEAGEGAGLDSSGNAYISGYANNGNLFSPTAGNLAYNGPTYNGFVVELSPSGASITASTYFGAASATTQAFSLALDPTNGNIVIGGLTNGIQPPTGATKTFQGGTTDGFVASFAQGTLNLVASTYLGGTSYDQVNSVAVDPSGGVYAAGLTASGNAGGGGNFPTSAALNVGAVPIGQQTAFLTKFNNSATLSSRSYSTIWGLGGEDANSVAADVNGVAYVAGGTKSPFFTTTTAANAACYAAAGSPGGSLGAVAIAAGSPGGSIPIVSPACVNPNETQGYLLAIVPPNYLGNGLLTVSITALGGYLDLDTPTGADPANLPGCNLNLTKNGGSFSSGNVCAGLFSQGQWNAVAVDTGEQAYVSGQRGIGGPPPTSYDLDLIRFNRLSTAVFEFAALGNFSEDYGIAVNQTSRQEYMIGATNPAETTYTFPYEVPYPAATTPPPPPPTNINAPDSIVQQGGEDVAFLGVQWNDVIVTPSTVSFGTVSLGGTATPQNISTATSAGVAVSCTVPPVVLSAGSSIPNPFTITPGVSTGTYSVAMATTTPGVYYATATFATGTCTGGPYDNATTTVTITGVVSGPLNATPNNTLTSTSVIGSGIIMPYGTTAGNQTITVAVTTAVGSIPYRVSQIAQSPNFPNCGLVNLGGTTVGNATPPPGPTFTITINAFCAATLPLGTYTENISVAPQLAGESNTVLLPFSLTINPPVGGVTTTTLPPNFDFATPTSAAQSGSFSVQNTGTSTVNYNLTYSPQNACVIGDNVAPLPLLDQIIITGSQGTLAAGGSAAVTIQINPSAGGALTPGVYGYSYAVSSPNVPTVYTSCAFVFIGNPAALGGGIGFLNNSGYYNLGTGVTGTTINISVPAGYAAGNISQPNNVVVTGLANDSSTPWNITLPSFTPAFGPPTISFTPALPLNSAFTLTSFSGNPCASWAFPTIGNSGSGYTNQCFYGISINSTSLVAGTTYVGTVTFTTGIAATSPTAVLTVNLNVTAQPTLEWVNNAGAPISGLTFNSVVGSDTTVCSSPSSFFPLPISVGGGNVGGDYVTATGGAVPLVTAGITPVNSWLGLGGAQGAGQSVGNSNPGPFPMQGVFTIGNPVQAPGTYFVQVCVSAVNIATPGTYTGTVYANGSGVGPAALPITFIVSGVNVGTTKVGVFRDGFAWVLDANGNMIWDGTGPGLDDFFGFAPAGAGGQPVTGDWDGSGTTKVGVFYPATGTWYLDYNGNGVWDGPLIDRQYTFIAPMAGDVGVTGDWTGSGTTKIGVFRNSGQFWILDTVGNGVYTAATPAFTFGGIPGDQPVTGDWTGNGTTKIGIVRSGFLWLVDSNGDGKLDNLVAYGTACPAGDTPPGCDNYFPFGGVAGDVFVTGDWTGQGVSRPGLFRDGFYWLLGDTNNTWVPGDYNLSVPTGTGSGAAFPFGGVAGDVPVTGKWYRCPSTATTCTPD